MLVWDIQTRRTTILAPDGSRARSYQGETPQGATLASPVGWLEGGRVLDHLLAEAAAGEDRAEVRRQAAETEFPARFPALGGLRIQPDGHVWVRRWSPPWAQDEPASWWVFDSAGVHLGMVETPAGLEVERVLDDVLVGVRRDELDVERVQVHGLRR